MICILKGAIRYIETRRPLFQESDKDVCAKVRIRIHQRLAITRDAFRATLELDNGESNRLTDIRVDIVIRDYISKEDALHKFSVG